MVDIEYTPTFFNCYPPDLPGTTPNIYYYVNTHLGYFEEPISRYQVSEPNDFIKFIDQIDYNLNPIAGECPWIPAFIFGALWAIMLDLNPMRRRCGPNRQRRRLEPISSACYPIYDGQRMWLRNG